MITDKLRFGLGFLVFGFGKKFSLFASLRLCGFLLFTIHCSLFTANAQTRDYAKWVNPFIGTGGHGHTFPGATLPFGMVSPGPDTRVDNWDGSSGYHYSDDIIYGFSHTHLSGTGIPDGCDILFMPYVGIALFDETGKGSGDRDFTSKFSHANEKAEPGYYSVRLDKNNLSAEMTTTSRVGLHRYSFPKSDSSNILLDLRWRDKVIDSELRVVNSRRIQGYRQSSSWAKDQKIYFVAEFSKPFESAKAESGGYNTLGFHMYRNGRLDDQFNPYKSRDLKAAFQFKTVADEQIMLKVAISHVSIEGARKNLAAELPGWDFEKVRADAKAAWNKELSKIEVSGGTDDQTTNFYTALYHTMIHPNVFNDVDGRYRGHDGRVHQLSDYLNRRDAETRRQKPKTKDQKPKTEHYTVFSLWDTFRAAHPLYTIIDQKRTVDFINTFIRIYEQGGRLPVWELWGEETDTMIGYHAVSVIADAMAKGIKGFDYEKAYKAAKHSAELDHFGLAAYKRRGYISMEDENESVSKTLEYAYDDWCIAQMASALARQKIENSAVPIPNETALNLIPGFKSLQTDYKKYAIRSLSFLNLFDPKTGFMRPKKNGGFVEPFAPNEVTFNYTEGNAWQYSFFVPHEISLLRRLFGGQEKFAAKLDELFTTKDKLAGREQPDITGLIGQYAHGNEPSHHIAYLYNFAGQPWKTQKYVRHILDEFYKPTPDGLIGNEDCGQMSAWYVLSASGFYEIAPAEGDSIYHLGTPLFQQVKYHFENGKTFVIKAPAVSERNFYVKSAKLNDRRFFLPYLKHEEIAKGGILEFEMTGQPDFDAFAEYPGESEYADESLGFVAVPIVGDGSRTFQKSFTLSIQTITQGAKIYYTTDGTEPTDRSKAYTTPLTVDGTSTVKAIAINAKGDKSLVAEATFIKKPNDWTVKVTSGYSTQYTGGGENAIVDGIRGTTNFASGEWQGVQGKPYEAVVDLQRETEIKELGASFLQVAGPWIWMPDRVEFEVSSDGVNFTRVAEIKPAFPQAEMTPTIKEYRQTIAPTRARYVRLRAFNFGKIPSWHPGAGGDPWIFIDEIFVGTA